MKKLLPHLIGFLMFMNGCVGQTAHAAEGNVQNRSFGQSGKSPTVVVVPWRDAVDGKIFANSVMSTATRAEVMA